VLSCAKAHKLKKRYNVITDNNQTIVLIGFIGIPPVESIRFSDELHQVRATLVASRQLLYDTWPFRKKPSSASKIKSDKEISKFPFLFDNVDEQ